MERKMNFMKSLKNDYSLLLTLLFPIMAIIVLSYLIFFAKIIDFSKFSELSFSQIIFTFDFLYLLIFSIIFLVGVILFAKRISYIKSFESENQTVLAKVVDIHYKKDRAGVDVEFNLHGNNYKKHFAIMNNSQTKFIHMDSEINLIIKDENPKKVLIEELYFS